jgi:hypothetical protein
VRSGDLLPHIRQNVSQSAKLMTDEAIGKKLIAEIEDLEHDTVNCSKDEYVAAKPIPTLLKAAIPCSRRRCACGKSIEGRSRKVSHLSNDQLARGRRMAKAGAPKKEKPKPKLSDKEQSERFKQIARELAGC